MALILQMLTLLLVLFSSYLQAQKAALCPTPNGVFVNANIRTCRSFIRCINAISVLQHCQRGTIFSGHRCIPGNQHTCNRVNANYFADPFEGTGATTPNPFGTRFITQPGVWSSGVQPLPGVWNNNVQTNDGRSGFSGQVNGGNPRDNGSPATQWNGEGSPARQWNGEDSEIRGFNPGFLGVWFDTDLERTGDGQWSEVNVSNNRSGHGQNRLFNWLNVNTNTRNNETVQIKG